MSNQLEKLKKSIKTEYVKNFELNLMKSSGFIPVDKRQSNFVVILNKNNTGNKAQIAAIINEKFSGLSPLFIPLDANEFDEVFTAIMPNTQNTVPSGNKPAAPAAAPKAESAEPTAEEMLVGIGWLTKEQLQECVAIAKEKELPLDAVFHEKQYLTYEQLVAYLKKKYGCDVISKSNIKVDKSILKMLPDDFVEKKQTIIMSLQENKLAVAMVNPLDKYTIREVSLSTGRSLNVYCIPYFEYDQYLKEY